jgi:hypothetical protein
MILLVNPVTGWGRGYRMIDPKRYEVSQMVQLVLEVSFISAL